MEDEVLDQPQSDMTDDDFFGDIDNEVINEVSQEDDQNTDDESKEVETKEESESTPTDTESEEEDSIDYQPFLDAISKKAKYNGESVKVDNIDDVIKTYQKGLNYDKVNQKVTDLENSRINQYVSRKAKEMGMTADEYMDQVESYEKQQEQAKRQSELDEMVENGVPEAIAREVIATRELRKEVQEEKNRLEQEKIDREKEQAKDKEYAEFIKEFPDVEPKDIPKDVFLNAQNSSLKEAYLKWQNAELKKQIEINKTNSKNKESSVGSTTGYGTKEDNHKTDPFLEGLEEDYW